MWGVNLLKTIKFDQNYLKLMIAGKLKITSNTSKIIPRTFKRTSPYKLNSVK